MVRTRLQRLSRTVSIPARYNGPARSGNGGYAAGVVGELVDGPAKVKLHSPPPLDTPLDVTVSDGKIRASVGGKPVLDAEPSTRPDAVVPFIRLEEAVEAVKRFGGWEDHGAPTCFVCGTERPDGLRIFPGPVDHDGVVAATWTPDETVAGADGVVEDRVMWAALDCPGAWAAWANDTTDAPYFPALGLMTAELLAPARPGERIVVVARYSGTDGRKLNTATALYSTDGELKAIASHLEIKVPADWAQ